MATDIWKGKAVYPCEPATEEELLSAIQRTAFGYVEDCEKLRQRTVKIPTGKIPWSSVRTLCVLGRADSECNAALKKARIKSGVYVNHSGDWLILIHPEESAVQAYADHCKTRLQFLGLYNTTLPELVLSSLTALKRLQVWNNKELSSINGLDKLTQLTELNLSFCVSLTALPGLGNLTQITYLYLSGCSSFTALPGLDKLTQLTELNLSFCVSLTALPGLDSLTQITYLNLSGCSSLTALPGLENLTQLTKLYLSGCSCLTALPNLENLTQLTELNLSKCGISELPAGIRNMKALRRLDLRYLKLRELPDWLPEIAEGFSLEQYGWQSGEKKAIVNLYGTTVENIPDMSIFDRPYEMVAEWFKKRSLNEVRPLNEIKVVFLGDGEAGKSHTIARLLSDGGDPLDYTDKSTPGIVIKNKEYDLDGRQFRVHYWDFGGQEILHSMHRIFLTERTLYVVLVNARDETQDARARYWLHNVKSFAKDAPVILVLNKIDQNPKARVNEPDLRSRYANLRQVVSMSALKDDREKFNQEFTQVLLEEIRQTGFLDVQWPLSWTQVKGELEHMEEKYIRGEQYKDICRRYSVDRNEKNLLHWFNDLGVSYCCCDDHKLEDYMILKPDWITNALYIILFNHCPGARNGLIPHESIHALLRETPDATEEIRRVLPDVYYSWDEISYVLQVFHKSQLSFSAGNDHEFIPMLCDPASAPAAQEYEKDEKTLEFRMEFDYLPNNLLHQLMVDRKDELRMDQVWRTGALFEQKETGLSAVVTIDGDVLRFFVRSTDPMHRPNTYLAMLKANVDRNWKKMGLQEPRSTVVYKLDGKQDIFDYEYLKAMLQAGQEQIFSMTWRRMMDIYDIMNQSAPEGLEEQDKLLDSIIKSCQNIQGNMRYIGSEEDDRNNRMRDDLELIGYIVRDQTRRGSSGSGRNPGELDIEVRTEDGRPWTIIEALRVSDGYKQKWNEHLDKLLGHYNAHGAPFLFLVTYVDDEDDKFHSIWEGYQTHIAQHSTGRFRCVPDSYEAFSRPHWANNQFIQTARCQYSCDGNTTTVYHIFVRIGR